jgi:hypothetical protein
MQADEVLERFLATGELPVGLPGFTGPPVQRRIAAEKAVREVLVRVVSWRCSRAPIPLPDPPGDVEDVVRARVAPMLEGLLPRAEAALALRKLPGFVRVVTPGNFAALIRNVPPRTAWDLANVLLDACGAPPLADDTPELDGLCHAGICFVLPTAFAAPAGTDDVLVHELSHLLHSARRGDLGLGPANDPLLHVAPTDRETFAWACEIWSTLERDPATRGERLRAWIEGPRPDDARIDQARLRAVLEAAAAGAGWAAVRGLARG